VLQAKLAQHLCTSGPAVVVPSKARHIAGARTVLRLLLPTHVDYFIGCLVGRAGYELCLADGFFCCWLGLEQGWHATGSWLARLLGFVVPIKEATSGARGRLNLPRP